MEKSECIISNCHGGSTKRVKSVTEIVCFGDSNTYGYDPRAGSLYHRQPKEVRWTGILNQQPDLLVINEGMNGREIPHTEWEFQNMEAVLHRNRNADILLLMLGSNDLIAIPDVQAKDVAARMRKLFTRVPGLQYFQRDGRKTVLISPVPMTKPFCSNDMRIVGVSRELGSALRRVAEDLGLFFADAASFRVELSFDGTHYSESGHRQFAAAILAFLRENVL